MAGSQVPRDPNMSAEVRRFLDDLSRRQETANIFYNLTATQATALLDVFTSALKGLVPASGGGTSNFLRADGTFAVPPGTSTGGLTRVGTLTTTSGTTASMTGLPSAKMFLLQLNGVSHDNGTSRNLRVALSINNGSSYGTAVIVTSAAFGAATGIWGCVFIDQVDGGAVHHITPGSIGGIGGTDTQSGAINALQLSWDGAGNFDAGSAEVYALN